jgi:hypothetical protein
MNVSTTDESYRNFTSCPYNIPVVMENRAVPDDEVPVKVSDVGFVSSLRMFSTFAPMFVVVLL